MNPGTIPPLNENESAIAPSQKFVFYGNAETLRVSDPETTALQQEQPLTAKHDPALHIEFRPVNCSSNPNEVFRNVNRKTNIGAIYIGCFTNALHGGGKKVDLPDSIWKLTEQGLIIDARAAYNLAISQQEKHKRVFALPEMLGRLAYCGFETISYKVIGHITLFAVRKKADCVHETDHPHMLLMRMTRIGKGGKLIGIYKFRTMYPYSEYIHDYVVNLNGYNSIGKPSGDFRITPWGRFARKIWLDEVPQIINLIKGEINIVGVRPITRFGYSSLPEELQQERIKYKPGLIPPNIALGKTGFYGVIEAETTYLSEMKISPLKTNFKYFFRSVLRILSLKAISA